MKEIIKEIKNDGYSKYELNTDQKKSITKKIVALNCTKVKKISYFMIPIEILLIFFIDLPNIKVMSNSDTFPFLYLIFHATMLISGIILFLISIKFNRDKKVKFADNAINISTFIIMINIACIATIDQLGTNQVTSYIVTLLTCGAIILIKPPFNLVLYTIPHLLFVTLVIYFSKDFSYIGNLINSSIFYFAVILISKFTYDNQKSHLIKNIVLSEINNKMEYLSNYDALTELSNRRNFETILEREVAKIKRQNNSELIMAMMDIDNFKVINDKFGHHAGDLVLKNVAKIINNSVREVDLAARWGGEEFIIMLANTSIDNAENIINRMREKIQDHESIIDGSIIKVTASFGLTKLIGSEKEDLLNCYRKVDEALYIAKNNGRNNLFII